jgi:hypothetical protein
LLHCLDQAGLFLVQCADHAKAYLRRSHRCFLKKIPRYFGALSSRIGMFRLFVPAPRRPMTGFAVFIL